MQSIRFVYCIFMWIFCRFDYSWIYCVSYNKISGARIVDVKSKRFKVGLFLAAGCLSVFIATGIASTFLDITNIWIAYAVCTLGILVGISVASLDLD